MCGKGEQRVRRRELFGGATTRRLEMNFGRHTCETVCMRISIRPAHPFDAPAIAEFLAPTYGVQTSELEVQVASPDASAYWVGIGDGRIVAAAKATSLGAGSLRMIQLDWLAVRRHAGDTITARKLLDAAVGDMPALALVDQADAAVQNVLRAAGFENLFDERDIAGLENGAQHAAHNTAQPASHNTPHALAHNVPPGMARTSGQSTTQPQHLSRAGEDSSVGHGAPVRNNVMRGLIEMIR